jgi:hypothetical protein
LFCHPGLIEENLILPARRGGRRGSQRQQLRVLEEIVPPLDLPLFFVFFFSLTSKLESAKDQI